MFIVRVVLLHYKHVCVHGIIVSVSVNVPKLKSITFRLWLPMTKVGEFVLYEDIQMLIFIIQ